MYFRRHRPCHTPAPCTVGVSAASAPVTPRCFAPAPPHRGAECEFMSTTGLLCAALCISAISHDDFGAGCVFRRPAPPPPSAALSGVGPYRAERLTAGSPFRLPVRTSHTNHMFVRVTPAPFIRTSQDFPGTRLLAPALHAPEGTLQGGRVTKGRKQGTREKGHRRLPWAHVPAGAPLQTGHGPRAASEACSVHPEGPRRFRGRALPTFPDRRSPKRPRLLR